MDDVELLAWYPKLSRKHEKLIKKKWKTFRIYGKSEWFPSDQLQPIQSYLELYDQNMVNTCDPYLAILSRKRT